MFLLISLQQLLLLEETFSHKPLDLKRDLFLCNKQIVKFGFLWEICFQPWQVLVCCLRYKGVCYCQLPRRQDRISSMLRMKRVHVFFGSAPEQTVWEMEIWLSWNFTLAASFCLSNITISLIFSLQHKGSSSVIVLKKQQTTPPKTSVKVWNWATDTRQKIARQHSPCHH